jgi:IS5 family transposase
MAVLVTCSVCGVGFHARSDAIYCSAACRQKAHRARMARRIAAGAVRPEIARTVQRAREEQRRARELCRAAADALRESVASHQRLIASPWVMPTATERG